MQRYRRVWVNLILAPLWFLIVIIIFSIYFVGQGVSETKIPSILSAKTPTIILVVQILLLITLVISSRKNGWHIFKNGWKVDTKISTEIYGGILTGILLALLYIFALSPIQVYMQNNIGDYIPAGETMTALGNQTIPFFIANVILAPFIEESLYRNYALSTFMEKYGSMKSIVLTSFMFGLLHWLGGFWYILMTWIIIGVPFAFIAVARKNIIWVFIAHLTLNLIEFFYIFQYRGD